MQIIHMFFVFLLVNKEVIFPSVDVLAIQGSISVLTILSIVILIKALREGNVS